MSIMVSEPEGGGDFERAPSGTHLGVCFRIYELGTRHKEFDGETRIVKEVLISWELPGELMTDGRPFAVSSFYTHSLHEKSKLRAHLEAWRGKPFTKAELQGFDLTNVLNKGALLNIGRTNTGKEKLLSVSAILKGMAVPPAVNDVFAVSMSDWKNPKIWEKIPDGFKKIITSSDEYKAMKGIVPQEEDTIDPDDNLGPDSDEDRPPF